MIDTAGTTGPAHPRAVPICAIGASAGGVGALQKLFRELPADLGLAYVVVVHLAPNQPSSLHELLSICTQMAVRQVDDAVTLEADRVYVIPPNRELVIEADTIRTRPFSEPRGMRAPVDVFFRSVAAGRGDGIAVILSGAGEDGAIGVRAIKEAGGIILVQDPSEATFGSMPQSAITGGAADLVAPISRLAEYLTEVARSKEAVRSLDADQQSNDLRRIIAFLRARTGHDFSSYKRATVLRRVMRRMQVCRTSSLSHYADHLLAMPEEAKALLSDLLISVTSFFRDHWAFDVLARKAIGPILDDLHPASEESVRAWVVGCATGEEAYSVAMLLHEEATRRKLLMPMQVFATDLDEAALVTAREGRYPRTIEADVSEERLGRFFIDEGPHYRVRRELRESVLFASHSVIREPPFMRLDLITCRNLLIYLERSLQQQLCSLFHYGLKPGRFLFLGSAETADAAPDLFAPIDREARLYFARHHVTRVLPVLPQFDTPERMIRPEIAVPVRADFPDQPAAVRHASALERAAPPSALVDESLAILNLSPDAGRFILHSAGPVSNVLPAVVRPELRLDLRLALARALDRKEPTLTLPTVVNFEAERRRIALQVTPLVDHAHAGARAIVFFLDGGATGEDEPDIAADTRSDEVRRLHMELRSAQEALVASRSGHDASIQDLRATNEELQSINEEYRSTAEELETSKEELQSINEELHTVNAELKGKLASISVAHSDLQNLTAATEIGTLFLDPELRIKMFTPPIVELFNVTKADIGRTVTDFTHRLEYDGIEEDARKVIGELAPVEREIRSRSGRWYVMRLRPYRTLEDRIDGTVVTFVDITARRHAEEALRENEADYRNLFNSIDEGFCIVEVILDASGDAVDYRFLTVNAAFEGQTGLKDAVGRTMKDLVPAHEPHWFETYGRIARTGEPARFDGPAAALGRWYDVYAFRVGPAENAQVGILFKDILPRKRADAALRESVAFQRALIENVPQLVWRAGHGGLWTWSSPQWTRFTGLSPAASLGRGWIGALHPDDREQAGENWRQAERTGIISGEYRLRHGEDERYCWFQMQAAPIRDDQGAIVEWLGTFTDVDDLRAMQERQKVMVAELQHRTRNLLGVVQSIARQTALASSSLEGFTAAFADRLDALSRVQSLLSRADDQPITLGALVRSELQALDAREGAERVVVTGPQVQLRKGMVQTFALALHELATNALKYGALSTPEGRLSVSWRTYRGDDGERLALTWEERTPGEAAGGGGAGRDAGGFGRDLIVNALPFALQAQTAYDLTDDGLTCTIDLPLLSSADAGPKSP